MSAGEERRVPLRQRAAPAQSLPALQRPSFEGWRGRPLIEGEHDSSFKLTQKAGTESLERQLHPSKKHLLGLRAVARRVVVEGQSKGIAFG